MIKDSKSSLCITSFHFIQRLFRQRYDPLWEESIRLIEADGEDQARGLALEIAAK